MMPALAQQIPSDLTVEQRRKLDRYILDYIKVLRVSKTQPQPAMVDNFNQKYTELCRKRAEEEYKKHGRWFYCEDRREFGGGICWDEVVTYRTYWQLYARYGSLEKLPNYSKENHEKAIKFWQGRQMNHGTATVSVMMRRIHEGKSEFIPALERAVELAVSQLSPHTGMFHGPKGGPSGGAWSGYGATAETMKGMLRLIGYMGVENMPYRHVRADKLIENQEHFRKAAVSVKRNTSETRGLSQADPGHGRPVLDEPARRQPAGLSRRDGRRRVADAGRPRTDGRGQVPHSRRILRDDGDRDVSRRRFAAAEGVHEKRSLRSHHARRHAHDGSAEALAGPEQARCKDPAALQ